MIDKLRALQAKLQQDKLAEFKRRVSLGDLVTDRWQNAREYGFTGQTSEWCFSTTCFLAVIAAGFALGPRPIVFVAFAGLDLADFERAGHGHHAAARPISTATART